MPEFRLLSVVHTVLISDQQILLLRRCNTGHDDGFYGLPSGRLDGGEQLDEAAARELQEECGAAVHLKDLKMLGVMHIKTTDDERVDFFFTANRWQGEIVNAEPDKCDDLRWFPIDPHRSASREHDPFCEAGFGTLPGRRLVFKSWLGIRIVPLIEYRLFTVFGVLLKRIRYRNQSRFAERLTGKSDSEGPSVLHVSCRNSNRGITRFGRQVCTDVSREHNRIQLVAVNSIVNAFPLGKVQIQDRLLNIFPVIQKIGQAFSILQDILAVPKRLFLMILIPMD